MQVAHKDSYVEFTNQQANSSDHMNHFRSNPTQRSWCLCYVVLRREVNDNYTY